MEDTELRQHFANIDKRFSDLALYIKDQIEGLAIITGRSFALMHDRFDEIDEQMATKEDLALLESRLQGDSDPL